MPSVTDERRATLTLVLCCLAQFMVILDVSIVNVALPSIADDLGFTPATLAWVVNAYTLAFAGFLLLGGRAADLLGRREVFAGGLALFALASLAGGLAQDELTLVAARAAQGLGGAVVAPATLSILTTASPRASSATARSGLWGAMGAIGGASGALLGGVLTEALNWRWILIINVPIGLFGALAALRVVRTGRRDAGAARDFDLIGRADRHARAGRRSPTGSSSPSRTAGARRARCSRSPPAPRCSRCSCSSRGGSRTRPLVPLRIFALARCCRARTSSCSASAARCSRCGTSSRSTSSRCSATRRSRRAGVPADAADDRRLHAGRDAADRAARRRAGARGRDGADRARDAAVHRRDPDGRYLSDVLAPSLLCAAGIGFSFVPVTIAATAGVRRTEAGLASGLVNTSRQMGGSVGLALLATVATQRTAALAGDVSHAEALTEGFHRAFALGAGIRAGRRARERAGARRVRVGTSPSSLNR